MLRPLRLIERRVLPQGWLDLLRQLALFGIAYYGYQIVRGAVDGKVAVATWNATKLIWLEHQLHFFVEPSVQAWATSKHWIMDVTSLAYVNLHFIITLGALVWLYLRRNPSFYFVRNMFMVAMALALVGYVLYPTAPPRLMPEWGFTDPVAQVTGVGEDQGTVSALVNLYAAVPSMHVAMALMVGISLARLVRPRPLKVVWSLYPVFVTFVVVATGNHYLMDAILGAVVALLSALAASQGFARLRPAAWRFLPVRADVLAAETA
jgi:membrane-associated phospholipid phosphatase